MQSTMTESRMSPAEWWGQDTFAFWKPLGGASVGREVRTSSRSGARDRLGNRGLGLDKMVIIVIADHGKFYAFMFTNCLVIIYALSQKV